MKKKLEVLTFLNLKYIVDAIVSTKSVFTLNKLRVRKNVMKKNGKKTYFELLQDVLCMN